MHTEFMLTVIRKFIMVWSNDPQRYRITIYNIATYTKISYRQIEATTSQELLTEIRLLLPWNHDSGNPLFYASKRITVT